LPIKESSLAGYCAVTGRSYVVPDAYGDLSVIDERLHFDRSWDKKTQFRTRDVMCTPAMFKGKIMGVIQVLNGKDRSFQESDLNVLKNISHMVGYALYHAKIYDDLATMKKMEMEKARFMQIILEENDYIPVLAESAEEGYWVYEETKPDLIIVDMMMEIADAGTDFTKKVREHNKNIPIYMLSSVGAGLSMNIDYNEIGLTGILQKPIDNDLLLSLLTASLK
jgi:CheY-like chemotaxis protein